jgi:hypothetical protein
MRKVLALLLATALLSGAGVQAPSQTKQPPLARWSREKAREWSERHPWLVGCNYIPGTAINQLEMWQADTFDPKTIDRELGWAQDLGFNSVRVFLHHLLWQQDKKGFLARVDRFLQITDRRGIGVVFVPLDSVWDPFPKLGKQRAPRPGVHNSGWVQSPGVAIFKDPARHDELKPYIQGLLLRYARDRRVHAWDLLNEPENTNNGSYGKHEPKNKAELALALLKKVFAWAREVNPSQPLTAGVWAGDWGDPKKLSAVNRFMLEQSDVISFHCYGGLDDMRRRVEALKRHGRPLLCTEYMARPHSTFDPILGYLKKEKVGAYNWGFVAGKTNTIYPWSSWQKPLTAEPKPWFHDIFRADGTPFDAREVRYVKRVTGKAAG